MLPTNYYPEAYSLHSRTKSPRYFRAMKLATATPADAARLARHVNAAYRGETARQGWTTESDLLDGQRIDEAGVADMLALPGAAMLLALNDDGELLGSFHAQVKGPVVYLGMLAVTPSLQTQGVGKFLLQAAENYGHQHGCTTSKMTVISVRAELIAYYERRGYHLNGATEPFPTDPRYGIPRQPLVLLVLEKALA